MLHGLIKRHIQHLPESGDLTTGTKRSDQKAKSINSRRLGYCTEVLDLQAFLNLRHTVLRATPVLACHLLRVLRPQMSGRIGLNHVALE